MLEVPLVNQGRRHAAEQQTPAALRQLCLHLLEEVRRRVVHRLNAAHVEEYEALCPQIILEQGKELVSGAEEQVALEFAEDPLVAVLA